MASKSADQVRGVAGLFEFKFKTFHTTSFYEMRPRWVVGLDFSSDAWPLTQLQDEQITDLRPYMK